MTVGLGGTDSRVTAQKWSELTPLLLREQIQGYLLRVLVKLNFVVSFTFVPLTFKLTGRVLSFLKFGFLLSLSRFLTQGNGGLSTTDGGVVATNGLVSGFKGEVPSGFLQPHVASVY